VSAAGRWSVVLVGLALAWAALHSVEVAGDHFDFAGPWPIGAGLLPEGSNLALWAFSGSLAWALATWGLSAAGESPAVPGLAARLRATPDGAWIGGLAALAFAVAAGVRVGVTSDVAWGVGAKGYALPIGDLPSAAGWVPPLLVGGTVPAVFLVARRWLGSGWARVAAALFATAPMAVLGGATLYPGSGLAFAAAWALWLVERGRDEGAPPWVDPALAVSCGLAVALDGAAGAGLCVVFAGCRAWDLRGTPGARRRGAVFAATLALALGGAIAGLIACGWAGPVGSFDAWRVLVVPAAATVRVSIETLGWPIGIVPAFFAAPSRGRTVALALIAGVIAPNLFVTDLGPGLYGPERLHAALVPVVLLVVLGLATMRAWNPSDAWGRTVAAATLAAVLVSAIGYTPERVRSIEAATAERDANPVRRVPGHAPLRGLVPGLR